MKVNVIKGNTKACLDHFFEHYGKDTTLIRYFMKIASTTEKLWRGRTVYPEGGNKLKLRYFLTNLGYEVTDLFKENEDIYNLGKIIAYDIMTAKEVSKYFSFPQHQYVYRFFDFETSVSTMSEDRMKKLRVLIGEKAHTIAEKEQKQLADIAERLKLNIPAIKQASTNGLVEDFAAACTHVRGLGKILLESPVEVRAAMRKQMKATGRPLLHETWDLLKQLMVEKEKE
jgi:hypothetical protein